jgi:hypothetical protein
MENVSIDRAPSQLAFRQAVRSAFWRAQRARLRRGCNELLEFESVHPFLDGRPVIDRGYRDVLLDRITGSVARSQDFDLAFAPKNKHLQRRWTNAARISTGGASLSPVILYKVADAYFVVDGNHRVSVARYLGRESIQARVLEFDASLWPPEPSCQRLGVKLAHQPESCRKPSKD